LKLAEEDVTMYARTIALVVAMTLLATGPLAPVVAQQSTQLDVSSDTLPALDESRYRGPDFYDLGATVITAAKTPLNFLLCGIGVVVGAGLFGVTLGSGYKAATHAVEEGCRGRWIVTGNDLRPAPGRSDSYEMSSP
jgi:hypothetical protein